MLIDKTIREFVDEVAADSPAPGGGSAAALLGALSAALCAMVMNLSRGTKFTEIEEEAKNIRFEAESLKERLLKAVDEDAEVFNKVMQAYRLPKDTIPAKEERIHAIQQAMREATELPLQVATFCLDLARLALRVLAVGNPNAASDAAVAGVTAYAALQSALFNVKINLGSVKNEVFVTQTKELTARMKLEAAQLNAQLLTLVDAKF